MNKILIGIIVVLIIGGGMYAYLQGSQSTYNSVNLEGDTGFEHSGEEMIPTEPDGGIGDGARPLDEILAEQGETQEIIGKSVDGRDIIAYHFGTGKKELLLIGGIHGGYSWNTALLAQQAIGHFAGNVSEAVPKDVTITIIPVLNPDGLQKVVNIDKNESFTQKEITGTTQQKISARFNANKVDINRNFDCNWKETGVWKSQNVSGGSAPFSEPESAALKAYVEKNTPDAVVVWYSSAGGVYASQCEDTTLPETQKMTNLYAQASGYTAHDEFDSYEVNGDLVNWLAKKNIPAISVLLTDKESTEWTKNRKGIESIIKYLTN